MKSRTAQTLRDRLWVATLDRRLEAGFRRELESMSALQLVLLSSSDEAVTGMQSAHVLGFPPTDGQTRHGVGRWSFGPDAAPAQVNAR